MPPFVTPPLERGSRIAVVAPSSNPVDEFTVDFGHTWPPMPIPIGGHVEIDPEREAVRLE